MDSPSTVPCEDRALRTTDYLLLISLCLVLFGFSLINPRILGNHETTHCLNVREIFSSGEWLIPTYGERRWLERPPLPQWMTAIGVALCGDLGPDRAYRIGSIFIATLAVLVFAWAIASCRGRMLGLMSGGILATMREYSSYATGIEADVFLASFVTIAGSLLLRILAGSRANERGTTFLGGRSWLVVLFFVVLGATNAMKGPLFGMIFLLLPLAVLLAWGRSVRQLLPLVWLWGWLLALVIGAAWPVYAYLKFPDIVDLWAADYGLRVTSGAYVSQPFWYYAAEHPWNIFPWTIPAIVGLFATARSARRGEDPTIRFIWCWAIAPVLFLSLFKGKHHHYMLSCLAPAAFLAAVGACAIWQKMQTWPNWLRQPWISIALLGIPGAIAIYLVRGKIPGSNTVHAAWIAGWLLVVFGSWWIVGRTNKRIVVPSAFAMIVVVHCAIFEYLAQFAEESAADRAFVEEVRGVDLGDKPLLVLNDHHVLNASWFMFYLGEHAQFLHNTTFLRGENLNVSEVYVVCRMRDEVALKEYGHVRPLVQSKKTRFETSPIDRYTLYALRFHSDLARVPANVRMTTMQCSGREEGPHLKLPRTDRTDRSR